MIRQLVRFPITEMSSTSASIKSSSRPSVPISTRSGNRSIALLTTWRHLSRHMEKLIVTKPRPARVIVAEFGRLLKETHLGDEL